MNARPSGSLTVEKSDSSRVLGSTDYAKFDEIAKAAQFEVEEQEFRAQQAESAKWCQLDHVHGPSCKPSIPGCSHDLSSVCCFQLYIHQV